MGQRSAARIAAALALGLLTACSSPGGSMPASQPPSAGSASPAPEESVQPPSGTPPTVPTPSGRPPFQTMPPLPDSTPVTIPQDRWQAILDDLASRGGAVEVAPEVERAERVTWPDSSLGCPSPGTMYTQQLIDGMRVVVTADGQRYDYRFGTDATPKLCTRAR
ncbi:MAG: hypothetical protein VB036_16655 [Propionicimonas sp.]|nr:hypothetical protein [Propionicimonas sp.]